MRSRAQVVADLIAFSRPLDSILEDLSRFGWDSHKELARVGGDDIYSVLQRYLDDTVSAREVERWANAIEGRDDIGMLRTSAFDAQAVIYQLANPALTEELSKPLALRILRSIRPLR